MINSKDTRKSKMPETSKKFPHQKVPSILPKDIHLKATKSNRTSTAFLASKVNLKGLEGKTTWLLKGCKIDNRGVISIIKKDKEVVDVKVIRTFIAKTINDIEEDYDKELTMNLNATGCKILAKIILKKHLIGGK